MAPAKTSLYTIPETAALLKCSRMTVYRLIAKGSLRTKNIGVSRKSVTRVLADSLTSYIKSDTLAKTPRDTAA